MSIPDVIDPTTWVCLGDTGQDVSPAVRALAIQAIQRTLAPPEPSSQFWPSPLQALADDVDRLKRHVGLLDA